MSHPTGLTPEERKRPHAGVSDPGRVVGVDEATRVCFPMRSPAPTLRLMLADRLSGSYCMETQYSEIVTSLRCQVQALAILTVRFLIGIGTLYV